MDINFTFTALLDLLAFVQGTLLGILLMLKYREHLAYFFLGLFLFSYSSELLISVLFDSAVFSQVPRLLYLPVTLYLWFMPALLLYVKSVSRSINWKKYAWLFIPGIIEIIAFVYLFLQPVEVKTAQFESGWTGRLYGIFIDLAMIYSLMYVVIILREVKKYRHEAMNYFADMHGKLLSWVKWTCILIGLINLVLLASNFVPSIMYARYIYPVISAINVVFIFWIALSGFRQELFVMKDNETQDNDTLDAEKQSDEGEPSIDSSIALNTIHKTIVENKYFKESDLNLASCAQHLNISQRRLSEVINQKAGVNFNQFINKMRVDEAKALLTDPKYSHLSIMGIGYEVGFNSKTSFYTTFKRETNMTPAEYQKGEMV